MLIAAHGNSLRAIVKMLGNLFKELRPLLVENKAPISIVLEFIFKQDYILAEFSLAQSGFDRSYDSLIGMDRIAASAEDRGIPGLKAEPEGIRRHIGAGLIDIRRFSTIQTLSTPFPMRFL